MRAGHHSTLISLGHSPKDGTPHRKPREIEGITDPIVETISTRRSFGLSAGRSQPDLFEVSFILPGPVADLKMLQVRSAVIYGEACMSEPDDATNCFAIHAALARTWNK